ncbi:MAG: hypothetical protein AMXMBFR33_21330 [Candidatus Xenobia bacterium]
MGSELAPYLPEVARLRIEVFRAWPYLYAGTLEYEADYLKTYLNSPESLTVLVRDGEQVVGASTALPLDHETEPFTRPFRQAGYRPEEFLYFGESVLLPAYRGRGLGGRFFQEREDHARRLGRFQQTCFAAVERPPTHPLRPADYLPLNSFWERRGYKRQPELAMELAWQDVDQPQETEKRLVFWLKPL